MGTLDPGVVVLDFERMTYLLITQAAVITRVSIQCMFLPTTSDLMLWRLLLRLLSFLKCVLSVLTLNISCYNTLAVSLLLRVGWI